MLNGPFCLEVIYNIENQRGRGHGKRIMKIALNLFQIVIHTLNSSRCPFNTQVKISDWKK